MSAINSSDVDNHKLVQESILRYLNTPSVTSYGYLIRGEWGSGKTYFWKEKVVKSPMKKPAAYVSLFDAVSVEKLKSQILISYLAEARSSETRTCFGKKFVKFFINLWPTGRNSLVGALSELSQRHLGFDAKELLSAMDLSVDPLRVLPRGVVVCLDDLERATIPYKDLLGVANYLVEHKNAKLVFLAAEDKIEDKSYQEFKEKVVRRTLSFETSLIDAYDAFFLQLKEQERERFEDFKPIFLRVFSDLKCKNLRTLQKAIGVVNEFINFDTSVVIPTEDIAFLIYLSIADATLPLGGSFEEHKVSRDIFGDKDKMSESKNLHQELYLMMKESKQSFSHKDLLYSFVKDSLIDKGSFEAEYAPKKENESEFAKLIRWGNEVAWWSLSDDEFDAKMEEFKNALNSESNDTVERILKVFIVGMRLSSIFGAEQEFCNDVFSGVVKLVKKNADEDEKFHFFEFDSSKFANDKVNELYNIYRMERKRRKVSLSKEAIWNDLKNSERSNLYFDNEEDFVAISELLSTDDFLVELKKKRDTPLYFASVCHAVRYGINKNSENSEYDITKNTFSNFLGEIKSGTTSKVERQMIERVIEFDPVR